MTLESLHNNPPSPSAMKEQTHTLLRRWLNENPIMFVCITSFGLGMAFVGLLTGDEHGGGALGAILGGIIGLVEGALYGLALGVVFWVLERVAIFLTLMFKRFIDKVFPKD